MNREVFKLNFYNLQKTTKVKQIDVAKAVGVDTRTVSAWATGRGYPRPDSMGKLCEYFGIHQSALTDVQKPEKNQEDILVEIFRSLSDEGKQKMLDRANEMKLLYPIRRKNNE